MLASNALKAVSNTVGSRVLRALEMTLSEPKYMQTLVKQYGLCFEEVKISCLLVPARCMLNGMCSIMKQDFRR